MTPGTWFAPDCPTWCEGRHASILTDDDADELGEGTILHARELVAVEGLAVELSLRQHHPAVGISTHPPALFVYLDERTADGAGSTQLRAWARALTAAADAADTFTGKNP